MAGFDNDDFSLSVLMQGHKLNVTVISKSSDEEDNYGGLLECGKQLAGQEISKLIKGAKHHTNVCTGCCEAQC